MPIHFKGAGGSQKTPTISVSSSGLITATAGKKSATKQLSSSMDADFVAANIKKGVNIFGINGSLEGWEVCRFSNYSEVPSHNLIDAIDIDLAQRNGTLTITLREAVSEVLFFNAVGGPFDGDGYCDFFVFEVPEVVTNDFLESGNAYGFYHDEDGNLEYYSSVEWELFYDKKTIQLTAWGPWGGPYPNTTHVCGYLAVKK